MINLFYILKIYSKNFNVILQNIYLKIFNNNFNDKREYEQTKLIYELIR